MKGNKKQRLSSREFELLQELEENSGDMLVGFLFSACSSHQMNKVVRESAKERLKKARKLADKRYRMKKRLKQLEKEGYVKLVKTGSEPRVKLTPRGRDTVAWRNMEIVTKNKDQRITWDGQWTVVFFDVPQEEKHTRYSLGALLKRCGFHQTQMSVYVYPYPCPELAQALANYPTWGRYCQVIRGTYYGDDLQLQKVFDL